MQVPFLLSQVPGTVCCTVPYGWYDTIPSPILNNQDRISSKESEMRGTDHRPTSSYPDECPRDQSTFSFNANAKKQTLSAAQPIEEEKATRGWLAKAMRGDMELILRDAERVKISSHRISSDLDHDRIKCKRAPRIDRLVNIRHLLNYVSVFCCIVSRCTNMVIVTDSSHEAEGKEKRIVKFTLQELKPSER